MCRIFLVTTFVALLVACESQVVNLISKDFKMAVSPSENGLLFEVLRDGMVQLSGHMGRGLNVTTKQICNGKICTFSGENGGPKLTINAIRDNQFRVEWKNIKQVEDCFVLKGENNTHWFGGPERYHAEWPVENVVYDNLAFVTSKGENQAVIEPYWLSERGIFINAFPSTPLFIDQNIEDDLLCLKAGDEYPYINRTDAELTYDIGGSGDPKITHTDVAQNSLGTPSGHPNEKMIREPIWTTWGKYKAAVSDEIVLEFLQDIIDHNFTKGQIELDDKWEDCYGSLTFDATRFGKINETVKKVHDAGFRITLWVHPFVNLECPASKIGLDKGYFYESYTGNSVTSWWNGNESYHIDYTKPEAVAWFRGNLQKILGENGIDNFKFDAGETDWLPQSVISEAELDLQPNVFTKDYMTVAASFGDLIEVRCGWRTQNLPVFVRMLDKDSRWTKDNGLQALIITLLQMNMIGYTMVLPDLIGGNGYGAPPTAELLVRWTQATVFMPTMQFSFLPWDFPSDEFDTTELVRKAVDLHAQYADEILKAMDASISDGTPVNPPIWWVDSKNKAAMAVNDEFLLGESILAAPVVVEGAVSRDVFLPSGSWKDGNTGTIYHGNQTLKDYPAPIDVLPYFIKQ